MYSFLDCVRDLVCRLTCLLHRLRSAAVGCSRDEPLRDIFGHLFPAATTRVYLVVSCLLCVSFTPSFGKVVAVDLAKCVLCAWNLASADSLLWMHQCLLDHVLHLILICIVMFGGQLLACYIVRGKFEGPRNTTLGKQAASVLRQTGMAESSTEQTLWQHPVCWHSTEESRKW